MRFQMARALVGRARERAAWIGDDHGDPYEEALLTRSVSVDMKIALKEILDHLRSALDYAAREVCDACGAATLSGPIYFPIVSRSFRSADFRSRVGKLMPSVLENRPDLLPILASFQPFADAENGWLADLATLSNETKHEQLSVNEIAAVQVSIFRNANGSMTFDVVDSSGTSFKRFPLMLGDGFSSDGTGKGHFFYLCLTPINEELLYFLRKAISGVDDIIGRLESAIAAGRAF